MPHSKLVNVTRLSPNCTQGRTKKIDRLTPHHTAGCGSVETVLGIFVPTSRKASCNYVVGNDGRIGLCVDEANRAWTSSSGANDNRAITFEVINSSMGGQWPVSAKAFEALVALCTDICQRYNKNKLLYIADKNTALAYQPKDNEMLLTMHQWFASTNCPGPYLKSKFPELAQRVTANLNKSINTSTDIIGKPEEEEVTQEQFNRMAMNWINELSQQNNLSDNAEIRKAFSWNADTNILTGDDRNNLMIKKFLTKEEFIASMYRFQEVYNIALKGD